MSYSPKKITLLLPFLTVAVIAFMAIGLGYYTNIKNHEDMARQLRKTIIEVTKPECLRPQ